MDGSIYLLERLEGPGITGHIRDASTGLPLQAREEIQGRISDQVRARYSEPQYGRFTRLLNDGAYTVLAGLSGYERIRVENVIVSGGMTEVEIELIPVTSYADENIRISSQESVRFEAASQAGNSINFSLELPTSMKCDLRIYNVLGREVGSMLNQWKNAGTHTMHFNASHLPSGVYFARISGDDFSGVQKFAVVH